LPAIGHSTKAEKILELGRDPTHVVEDIGKNAICVCASFAAKLELRKVEARAGERMGMENARHTVNGRQGRDLDVTNF
jgi:hypothetical protein